VIPLLNGEAGVAPFLERLIRVLDRLAMTSEVILVDDGSRDGTVAALEAAATRDRRLRVIVLRRNYGETAAMMAGIDHARGRVIVSMDGDLQSDPEDIPRLLDRLGEGFDVVSGWRKPCEDTRLRLALSRGANGLISLVSGVSLRDHGCTLKAYRADVIRDVRPHGEMHRFVPIHASWQGARVTELVVGHRAREHGARHDALGRLAKVLLDLMVAQFLSRHDARPIYVFGFVGFVSIAISFVAGLIALGLKLADGIGFIETPLPLLVVLTFLTGVMCFLAGLLAELLVRACNEAQGRPIYSIRDRKNFDDG
jgi:dolichol-phosphate mannosyltransferase